MLTSPKRGKMASVEREREQLPHPSLTDLVDEDDGRLRQSRRVEERRDSLLRLADERRQKVGGVRRQEREPSLGRQERHEPGLAAAAGTIQQNTCNETVILLRSSD